MLRSSVSVTVLVKAMPVFLGEGFEKSAPSFLPQEKTTNANRRYKSLLFSYFKNPGLFIVYGRNEEGFPVFVFKGL